MKSFFRSPSPHLPLAIFPLLLAVASRSVAADADAWTLDYRYAPPAWQTSICLPDDWQKTLVAKDGALLYDYPGRFAGFGTKITFAVGGANGAVQWVKQTLVAPRVPVVRTIQRAGAIEIVEEAFAVAPPQRTASAVTNPPRQDVLLVTLRNTGASAAVVRPTLTVESASGIDPGADRRRVLMGRQTRLLFPSAWETANRTASGLTLSFAGTTIPPRGEQKLAFVVARGPNAEEFPRTVAQAESARKTAERYWLHLDLPYDRLVVPDPPVQAQLDAAIRNIYQAREIKNGLPAFQVGPTCYRGLWVVDGSFLLEAMTYLGRADETRAGIKYLMSFQRADGGIMLIDGHWKETGIALWAVTRHARLTGDQDWLRDNWPKVERAVAFIGQMRRMPAAAAPNAGLIPDGFSDGGLADKVPEYTNIYWTLAGWRAAVEAARWLGNDAEAAAWQREYDDFYATFRHAAERDMKTDAHGHRYLPIRMAKGEGIPPQKAQWGFLHSVFPGKVFAGDDPLVQGNMAMLHACECQGLVRDTGWLKDGIWTYFASFYGHAWLWLGDGDKAARTLYAFGNHASPLLCWREEQMPVGEGNAVVGDMPHNWASAEFIRLTRHCLALERGNDLHLFEGFPAKWAAPGAVTKMNAIATEFGPLSLEFRVSKDGRTGELRLTPPRRTPPARIVWHLDHWSGQTGAIDLPATKATTRKIPLMPAK